jgi:5'-phosphate synthase pdxT subunit
MVEAALPNNREICIGVLALQGDFAEHVGMITACGAKAIELRHVHDLNKIDGLIIPGGESTTIAKLTDEHGNTIFDTMKKKVESGMPVYGTCMGTIFLAKDIENSKQGRLGLMDIKVKRNGFGPQRASFQTFVHIPELGDDLFPAVFIRAPLILAAGKDVCIMSTIDEMKEAPIIMARQKHILVTSFHPELTDDLRVHSYFLHMVREHSTKSPRTVSAQNSKN